MCEQRQHNACMCVRESVVSINLLNSTPSPLCIDLPLPRASSLISSNCTSRCLNTVELLRDTVARKLNGEFVVVRCVHLELFKVAALLK